jgi:hypothetical protein
MRIIFFLLGLFLDIGSLVGAHFHPSNWWLIPLILGALLMLVSLGVDATDVFDCMD